ncbi:DUF551 domain-containing protein [Dyadobacter sp. CY356]|uniref:DUF551 domain-containing protein n=1 Tax=Dyadobacter sp. CY356 TaxID=2906442 RepID=UPI0038D44EC4
MTEWQPIETAPKDGTRILICNNPKKNLCFKMHVASFNKLENEWIASAPQILKHVTHWMPLPLPPRKP